MKIFAHRGSKLIWPENTMLAFDKTHKAGATGFETDLRLSKDNEIILAHDDNLERFGREDITVSLLTADEVCEIEIPSIDEKYHDKIITLKQLLMAYPEKDYIFDCKISDKLLFDHLKKLLTELNFHNRIWFLTWSKQADHSIREIFPESPLFPKMNITVWWAISSLLGLGVIFEPDNSILSLPAYFWKFKVFKKGQVRSIQKRGKPFVGYLVNSEEEFNRCQKCGVDIILSDRSDLMAKFEGNA